MAGNFSRAQRIAKPATCDRGGVVVAQSRRAAEAGAGVLASGGNAMDAAVATAFAAGVVEPWMSGLGGGGLLLYLPAGAVRPQAIDFGMVSPRALDPADYALAEGRDRDLFGWPAVVEDRNLYGATAVAVPGQVAGLALALERFGTRAWAELLEPAIALAEEGLELDWFALHQIALHARELSRDPASAALWLEEGFPPAPLLPARRLASPALARTLRRLAEAGPRDFYEGALARGLLADLKAAGGCHSAEDLARYEARLLAPLEIRRAGGRLWVLPELNGGPTVAQALAQIPSARGARPDPKFLAQVAEALAAAFRHRLAALGDLEGRRGLGAPESCTTHISVVDREGNLVALTQTLLSVFGAALTLPESGILMNNGINWFDPRPGRPNALGAGKRPLCNYVPVVGAGEGRRFAIGASGGRKIISAMAQLSLFLLDYRMDLAAAMAEPRLDASDPERVTAPEGLYEALLPLAAGRFALARVRWGVAPNTYGIAGAVMAEEGSFSGAADPFHPWAEAVGAGETQEAP